MPALQRKVYQVSQEYLNGYHTAKHLYGVFDPFHLYNYIMSQDYREGYTRAMINIIERKD